MKPPNPTPPPPSAPPPANQLDQPISMTITSAAPQNSSTSATSTINTTLTTTTTNIKQIHAPVIASIATTAITPATNIQPQTTNLNLPTQITSTATPITTTTATTTANNSIAPSPALIATSQPTIVCKSPQLATHKPTATTTPLPATTNVSSTTINVVTQEQQAPLALTTTTQPSMYHRVILPDDVIMDLQASRGAKTTHIPSVVTTLSLAATPATATTTQSPLNQQPGQIQAKLEPNQLQCGNSIITTSGVPNSTLVILPQHSTAAQITPSSKAGTITAKTAQLPTSVTHVTLPSTTAAAMTHHSSTIQMQAPVTTIIPNLAQIPITAHQNTTLNQTTLINRPPQTLSVVPITTVSNATIKPEPTRNTCCLFDNGIRCDNVAGNASFSVRIQKIVGTKKMPFALDQTAGHQYICDHHKAIITVAKKSTAIARETKPRNYAANNNASNNAPLSSQHPNNLNDLALNQSTMQHQMNMNLLSNQNRLANNHPALLNNMPMRPGQQQIAYGTYPGPHTNQMVPMDTTMMTGGDNIPSSSGGVDVDLQQLQVNTLRRYKRHFRVQTRPGLNKMQLAESLKHHFRTLPIIEKEAITYFVYIVKCSRNKLDQNPKAD